MSVIRSPYLTLLHRVHRRTKGTTPILTEFLHVGEWSIDPEPCWCVWVGQHLVLESSFPPNAAPVPRIRDPEKLPRRVTQARKSWLLAPPEQVCLTRIDDWILNLSTIFS